MCFNEADGQFLWQAVHDKLAAGRVNDWPMEGICSTPLVEGNRVYYVSNRCEVVCADTEGLSVGGKDDGLKDQPYRDKIDARFIWRLDMIKELGVFPHNLATSSPLIVGDTLFVVTSNGVDEGHINVPKPEAPSFIALDKKTGKVLWQNNSPSEQLLKVKATNDQKGFFKQLVDRGQLLMHGQWSNATYAEPNGKPQIIFPGGDGWLRAFEPKSGKLIWKADCNPKNSKYELGGTGTRSDFLATPVIYDNKVYIGVGQDPEHDEGVGHLWCIDITKEGDVGGHRGRCHGRSSQNRAEQELGGDLAVRRAGTGRRDRDYVFGRTMSTCAIHDDLVYVAELAGYLHCLDAKTGKKYWDHDLQSQDLEFALLG